MEEVREISAVAQGAPAGSDEVVKLIIEKPAEEALGDASAVAEHLNNAVAAASLVDGVL